jgi:ParB family chromosome partitioning protein
MTNFTSIPLKALKLWKGNVRKTGSDEGVDELAASIRSAGLLQSLVVIRKGKSFAVVAGGRRLAALGLLREQGLIDDEYKVPCQIIKADAALEASLAENTVRLPMHPADQFDAFLALSQMDLTNADIAARFGVAERTVEQRLKLARVAPAILQAYRNDEIDLACVMAYAVTNDAKAQMKVWKSLPAYRRDDAGGVRAALTEMEIDATDRRVRFVTLEAYELAGGTTRRDLFTEGDKGIFVLEPDLLMRLVEDKLATLKAGLAAEGWAWTDARTDFTYADRSAFRRVHETADDLPEPLETEMRRLEEERDNVFEREQEYSCEDRRDEINARLAAIEDSRTYSWPDGVKETAGAVASISRNGEPEIVRGLIRPEDDRRPKAKAAKTGTPGGFSAALTQRLKKQRSAALAAELANRPDIALVGIVHTLMSDAFYVGDGFASCLRIRSTPTPTDEDAARAWEILEQLKTIVEERLPERSDSLFGWCMTQPQSTLLDLLALCTALSIDAVTYEDRHFARALDLDMRVYFTPTAENYFSHVSKSQIIEALTHANGSIPPAWERAKKSELAVIAERELAGSGWLPLLLRTA